MKKLILFSLLLLIFPVDKVFAQKDHDDFGIWSTITIGTKVSDRIKLGLLFEHRSCGDTKKLDCAMVMPSIEYKALNFLKLGLAFEYVICDDCTQLTCRPYVTLTASSGPLSLSLRELAYGEYTFEEKLMEWTSRTRVRAEYDIESISLVPYLASEVFISSGWEKSRHFIGAEYSFGKHSTVDLYYMYYIMRKYEHQRHILGLGYYFFF